MKALICALFALATISALMLGYALVYVVTPQPLETMAHARDTKSAATQYASFTTSSVGDSDSNKETVRRDRSGDARRLAGARA